MEKQNPLTLSRKKNKTEEDRYLLYQNIKDLIALQDVATLYNVFYPKIYKTSIQVFYVFKCKIPLKDIIQDSYLLFYEFVENYDASKATFNYHMQRNFFHYFACSIKKNYKHIFHEISVINLGSYIDKRSCLVESVLYKNIEDEIKVLLYDYSQRSRIGSPKDKYKLLAQLILEGGDMAEIAQARNITYQAVYQIKNSVRFMLAKELNKSLWCSYTIDTSNIYFNRVYRPLGYYRLEPR